MSIESINHLLKRFEYWIKDNYLILKETSSESILIASEKIIFGMIYTFITILTMMVWHCFRSWKLGIFIFLIFLLKKKFKLNFETHY